MTECPPSSGWELMMMQYSEASEREPRVALPTYVIAADLGQAVDYTAISIIQRTEGTSPAGRPEAHYQLRYLHRPPLGTRYPTIVADCQDLLRRAPLSEDTPLVVDKTGVGIAVVDMFTAAGMRPVAITITGGAAVTQKSPYDIGVPKRDLAGLLVALYQGRRLKVAASLPLAEVLTKELLNFKMKINVATGNDSYEAWRESIHDDLVLSVAMACWYAEHAGGPVGAWRI